MNHVSPEQARSLAAYLRHLDDESLANLIGKPLLLEAFVKAIPFVQGTAASTTFPSASSSTQVSKTSMNRIADQPMAAVVNDSTSVNVATPAGTAMYTSSNSDMKEELAAASAPVTSLPAPVNETPSAVTHWLSSASESDTEDGDSILFDLSLASSSRFSSPDFWLPGTDLASRDFTCPILIHRLLVTSPIYNLVNMVVRILKNHSHSRTGKTQYRRMFIDIGDGFETTLRVQLNTDLYFQFSNNSQWTDGAILAIHNIEVSRAHAGKHKFLLHQPFKDPETRVSFLVRRARMAPQYGRTD